MKALLALKDGTVIHGTSFGYEPEQSELSVSGEVVFNTSMTGYQEILTDPSYKWQIVCMSYPEIGNYGVNLEDVESWKPQVAGFIVKSYNPLPSNFRSTQSLGDYLKTHKIPGICGIDTRALIKHLRSRGAMPGLLAVGDVDTQKIRKQAADLSSMEGKDLVSEVSCEKSYYWTEGLDPLDSFGPPQPLKSYRIIAYDFGIKRNILRCLVSLGFEVKVVPANTQAETVLSEKPDGVFLSNGPGDPSVLKVAIENVSKLVGKVPMFGICLGHQILGLALGAKSYKLKFGHRGGNQPVMDLETGKVEITAQNHGFALDSQTFPKGVKLTHINLNDQTAEGLADPSRRFFSVQYHPEASPGPHDALYLFERFRKMIEQSTGR